MSMHVQHGFERGPGLSKSKNSFPTNADIKWDYRDAYVDFKRFAGNGSALSTSYWPTVIYVPYWVKLALIRNNLDASHLSDFARLKEVLSGSDLAKYVRAQTEIDKAVYKETYGLSGYTSAYSLFSLTDKTESSHSVISTVYPLANTDEIIKETTSLLSIEDTSIEIDFSKNYHRMELYKDNMILIYVDPGILNALQDRDYSKRFISDYLKALYTFVPIHEIGQSTWSRELFYHYMKLL